MNLTLRNTLNILKKNLSLIIVFTLFGCITCFICTKLFISPMYSTSVKLYVDTPETTSNDKLSNLNYAQKVVNTYIEMLNTDDFYNEVANKIGLSKNEIRSLIKISAVNNTEVFNITAKNSSAGMAKIICDAASETAINTISKLKSSSQLKIVSTAALPQKPSSPNIVFNSFLGLFSGLALSIIIIFLKDFLNLRVRDNEDLQTKYDIPVLGVIPYIK